MSNVGFLQLPAWHEALRNQLRKLGLEELLSAPALNAEDSNGGWKSLEPDEFFRVVQTGFHFEGSRPLDRATDVVITSDPHLGLKRLKEKTCGKTGIRGTLGGLHPLLDLFGRESFQIKPRRMLCVADGVVNFVLNEMEHNGLSLEAAVQEAQWQNVAPGNPTRHLHGLVACERLAILGSVLFGVQLSTEKMLVEGISKLELKDIQLAHSLNFSLRLLGMIERNDRGVEAWVRPCLIPTRYLLSQVRGGMESAYILRDEQEPIVFSGPGGGKETALQGMLCDWAHYLRNGDFDYPGLESLPLIPNEEILSGFYVRIALLNAAATLAQITQVFAEFGVEIKKLLQTGNQTELAEPEGLVDEIVFFTRPVLEGTLNMALQKIKDEVKLAGVKCCYRFENPVTRKA